MIESGTIESVAGTLSKGGPIAIAIVAILLSVLVWFRTNSTHAILRWLWRLIAGTAEGSTVAFNDFMRGQDDLMQFRFICGKARTVAQMHSLINWSQSNNEDVLDINSCGPYFDREVPGLKAANQRPTHLRLFGTTMGFAVISFLFIVSALFAVVPNALITIKDTEKWLLLGPESAKSPFSPNTERLSRDQCSESMEKKVALSGFSAPDIAVVCNFYADAESSKKFISNTVQQQHLVFGWFAAVLLCFMWITYRNIIHGNAAIKMAARLNRPRP